jgi:LemA protein
MSLLIIVLLAMAGLALILVFWVIAAYNGLVTSRNQFKNSFAQIDVQLKRRYDLIPNLVETAKGYLKHERETLEAVISARAAAVSTSQRAAANPADGNAMRDLIQAEGALTAGLGRLMAISESYPDLKANQTMGQVMEELRHTENKISFARQAYNDSATSYNTKREQFPTSVVAGVFSFTEAQLWQVSAPEERENVKVSFT